MGLEEEIHLPHFALPYPIHPFSILAPPVPNYISPTGHTMLLFKAILFVAIIAMCTWQAAALTQEPMGVTAGATFCKGIDQVPDNGYDKTLPMIPIPSFSLPNESPDKRPRWSGDIPDVHGSITILQANIDASGNWQQHVKLHQHYKNWAGHLILKATYANVDHFFAIGMDDDAGCILTTTTPTAIDWSYQLNGHKLRRE
jgi:hypothetical protein